MTDTPDNFLGLGPTDSDPATAQVAVLPVPYEGTVTYLSGTADGPRAIIAASQQVELFDEQLMREVHEVGVATLDPVPPADAPAEMMQRVADAAEPIMRRGQFLIALGGEHSITAPLVRTAQEVFGPLSVLQIDAHADLRDRYDGSPHNHACVMRRVLETTQTICQVGVRNIAQEEFDACRPYIDRLITPTAIADDPAWIERALDRLTERVYVTIDLDGFDPAVAPGVGTPEPGGLSWRDVIDLLRDLCRRKQVVAADVVELRPIPPNHVTDFLAARLAAKLIAYTQ